MTGVEARGGVPMSVAVTENDTVLGMAYGMDRASVTTPVTELIAAIPVGSLREKRTALLGPTESASVAEIVAS